MTDHVDFYFDVLCPWAYQASRWIRSVREQGLCEVDWRFFSLEEVNHTSGKKHPWERDWSYGWSLLRVAAHLRRRDPDLVDRWYEAVGRALHEDGRDVFLRTGAEAVAAEIGLPDDTVSAAIEDQSTHDDVLADHRGLVQDKGASGFRRSSSVTAPPSSGPRSCPLPPGPRRRLWELVVGWRDFPHLYELQRPKHAADLAHIGTVFSPYLEARAWPTVVKPAP